MNALRPSLRDCVEFKEVKARFTKVSLISLCVCRLQRYVCVKLPQRLQTKFSLFVIFVTETISRFDEGQPRPKYIFNKCGTNIYFFYSTEVWSITITIILNIRLQTAIKCRWTLCTVLSKYCTYTLPRLYVHSGETVRTQHRDCTYTAPRLYVHSAKTTYTAPRL